MRNSRLLVCLTLLSTACASATTDAADAPATADTCGQGAVAGACSCGGQTVSSGYCCGGAPSATACGSVETCSQGAVTASCSCGGQTVSSGYCCAGVAQAASCGAVATCSQGAVTAACSCGGQTVSSGYCCAGVAQAASCAAATIVADHRAALAFDTIPTQWLAAAKALTVHFAHTSHGSQILTGLDWLEQRSGTYSVAVREATTEGLPPAEAAPALRIYSGQAAYDAGGGDRWGGETYITPDLYWDGDVGRKSTRFTAGSGHYGFSMWTWCGQQSDNTVASVDRYLQQLAAFEGEFPDMRFVLFTGHTDGSDTPNQERTLKFNNQRVREFASAHGMALFDFADLESYAPDGTYYPNASDACAWCATWCANHPADCAGLPADGCVHSHPFTCVQKAKAFWWMMARLAGWDGK